MGLDVELVRIVEVSCGGDTRGAGAGCQFVIDGAATDVGDVGGRKVVGVAQHGIGERAEGGTQAEVLGTFVTEGDDELGDVGTDVLDVVQRTGFDVKHLPSGDDEVGEDAVVVQNGHQRGSRHAVREFIGVGVPVRCTHRPGVEHQALDGQILQDRQVVHGNPAHRAELGFLDNLAVEQ